MTSLISMKKFQAEYRLLIFMLDTAKDSKIEGIGRTSASSPGFLCGLATLHVYAYLASM